MVHIPNIGAVVQLFICCYVDVPFCGNGLELRDKSTPLWVLMKTGEMSYSPGYEYLLGISRDPYLRATFSKSLAKLSLSSKSDFQSTLRGLPSGLARKILRLQGTKSFVETRIPPDTKGGMEYLCGAVLLHLDDVRKISFTNEEGFGVFLNPKDLRKLIKTNASDKKRKDSLGSKGLWDFKIPTCTITSSKLVMELTSVPSDLTFIASALAQWKKESEQERLKLWNKAMRQMIG